MSFMQELYTSEWLRMYAWQNKTPPIPCCLNCVIHSSLMDTYWRHWLARHSSTFALKQTSRPLRCNTSFLWVTIFFGVMPHTVEQQLPSIKKARLGCRIIASHGEGLRQLLLDSEIFYVMDKHDGYNVRHTVRTEQLRCKGNARRLRELNTFRQNIALEEDCECTEPLFSLQAFHSFCIAVCM